MQKVSKLLMLVAIVATAVFTSCDPVDPIDETPGAPAITITDDAGNAITLGIEGEPGDMIDLTVTVDAPGVFNTLVISTVLGTETTEVARFNKNSGDTAVTYTTTFTYTFVEEWVDEAGILEFLAVDDQNQQTTVDLDVTTVQMATPITGYSATLLYAPTGDNTSQTFFSSNTGETWSVNEVNGAGVNSPQLDFGYYWLSGDVGATLAAPASWNNNVVDIASMQWSAYNATLFRGTALTDTDFDAIDDGRDIVAAFEAATEESGAVMALEVGDVIAFRVDPNKSTDFNPGKIGLIKVVAIEPGFNANDYISIEVKIEQ